MLVALLFTWLALASGATWDTENCGIRHVADSYIVGGQEAVHGQFPWQAIMYRQGRFSCGGTLIEPGWVLTAAHCIWMVPASDLEIAVGEWDYKTTQGTEQRVGVSEVIRHPKNVIFSLYNDFALLRLAEKVTYSDYVVQACPPTSDSSFVGELATVSGWGTMKAGTAQYPDILRFVDVPVMTNAECSLSYPGAISPEMLCAGVLNSGQDACQGDSGGPLVLQNSQGQFELIGVVSWGEGCGAKPGVFGRVTYVMSWIEETLASY